MIEGDDQIQKVADFMRNLILTRFIFCSIFEIQSVIDAPKAIDALKEELRELKAAKRQLELLLPVLEEQIKSHPKTQISDEQETVAGNNSSFNSVLDSSQIGQYLRDNNYPVGNDNAYKALVLDEPCLLVDESSSSSSKALVIFDPSIVDLSQLEGTTAVLRDSEGKVIMREIQIFKGRYQTYRLTADGRQEIQDLSIVNAQILGKLILLVKML